MKGYYAELFSDKFSKDDVRMRYTSTEEFYIDYSESSSVGFLAGPLLDTIAEAMAEVLDEQS